MSNKVNKDLAEITPAEELQLIRDKLGLNQWDFADKMGVTRAQVQYMERGFNPEEAAALVRRTRVKVIPYTDRQIALLCRWRSGMTTASVAQALRVSRMILLKRENRGDETLLTYWQKKGFRFHPV